MKLSEREFLAVGDVVQLDPEFHFGEKRGFFGACFMTITELKPFGAQGYVCVPGKRGEPPGAAYYRARWDEMERVGKALWVADARSGDAEDRGASDAG